MPEIKIFDALPEEEILAQMAEECVEASKAALKLRRARSGVNPTPVSEKDAFENLVEELADIYLCSIVFFGGELDDNDPCNMCDAVGDRMVEIMEQMFDLRIASDGFRYAVRKALFECSKFPPCTERMIVEGRLAEALYFSERMMEKTYKDLETEGKTNVG